MPHIEIPAGLVARASLGQPWAEWITGLPSLLRGLVEEWGLLLDGRPRHGYCSLVVPVRTTSGAPAVLKVGLPDDESRHEHLALQRWQGNGAVRLLRADPHRRALLLERLREEDLNERSDLEACELVAGLYGRLHVSAPPQLRLLTEYVDRWTGALQELPRHAPLPRRLVEQASVLARAFLSDRASTGTLLHADLHYGNVLAGDREPWLAIDPKPVSGDAHYEVAPLLWNRWEEVVGSGPARQTVRRRFHTVVDAAALDEARARDWVVVRAMHKASWTVREAQAQRRALSADELRGLTVAVTVAKAVQG